MTADPRLTAARAFLASSRGHKLAERPHSVLIREAAELRRQLGQVLDVIDEGAEDDGLEPYCTTCLSWVGMFHGMAGWHHFRGDPAPGGRRVLYEAGHPAAVGWIAPPGGALSPGDMRGVYSALADAAALLEDRAARQCDACDAHPANLCSEHDGDLDTVTAYRALAGQLGDPPAAGRLDSESWTCTSCGGLFIGGRTAGDTCGECQAAGPVLLAEIVDGLRTEVVDAIDVALSCSRAARQLGAIRAVLARVAGSEHGDRQMALEEIERIASPSGAQ